MARHGLLPFLLSAVLAVAAGPAARACGPFFAQPVFTFDRHPDLPMTRFAAGSLGALQPEYARSYLLVAYRWLAGAPLDGPEQQAALALWAQRLGYHPDSVPFSGSSPAVEAWLAARSAVPGTSPVADITVDREVPGTEYWSTYLNCPEDAFVTAERTLKQRIGAAGAGSATVRDWLAGRDAVFVNCAAGPQIPPALPSASDARAHADRAYQQAAAHFYAGDFKQAEAGFRAIAADPASPWRTLAPYLVARTLVRQGTLGAGEGKVDSATLARADAQITTVLADAALAPMHPAALRLRQFVQFRSQPEARRADLAKLLVRPGNGTDFRQRLADYTLLLDRVTGETGGDGTPKAPALASLEAPTDWILTWQSTTPEAARFAIERWRQTGALPWLVAAVAKVEAKDAAAPDLLAAAAKLPADSPGYAMANAAMIRLQLARGETDAARATLDRMLGERRAVLPQGTVNGLLALRLPLARSREAFVADLERVPVAISTDADGVQLPDDGENPVMNAPARPPARSIDPAAAAILNQSMGLAARRPLLQDETLSGPLRRELAATGWARAVVLKDTQLAAAYGEQAAALDLDLRTALAGFLSAAPADRHVAAVFALLRTPGLEPFLWSGLPRETPAADIDNLRDNWWCAATSEYGTPATAPALAFLTDGEREAARREWGALKTLPTGPDWLVAETLAWAAARPDDPRLPEALHLAVRATRYGCTGEQTSAFSKQAFQLLHRRFPKSEWAAKTKYHF